MKVIVVGGDGFCGWPLSLRLSNTGFDVCIVDNLSRRNIDAELSTNSLTPIASVKRRLAAWRAASGKEIVLHNINVAKEYGRFKDLVASFRPQTIVHLGEQRAAPYSMKNEGTRMYTVDNNVNGTHSILNAIVEVDADIHLVHLGTMGVYGYGAIDMELPEGYLEVAVKDAQGSRDVEILYPPQPGSVYHLSKVQDAAMFQFYAKNYRLRITDLHQGIVWGAATRETALHPDLVNRFDYDGDYGTVLNRFIVQAAKRCPLTVYGSGEQTRAFIHIENSMDCMCIAIDSPPPRGDRVRIYNQVTETHTLVDLAALIAWEYPETTVAHLDNPRAELPKNRLAVSNAGFLAKGLTPILLSADGIREIYDLVMGHLPSIDLDRIQPSSLWR